MSNLLFTPKAYQEQVSTSTPTQNVSVHKNDKIGETLIKVMQSLVVGLMFLLPIFFVPKLYATLGFDKVLLTVLVGLAVVVIASLSLLRFSRASSVLPLPLILFAVLFVSSLLSAFLSGDIYDSLRGSAFEVQTAGFLGLLLLAMAIPLTLQRSKIMSLSALIAFAGASGLIILYNLSRIIFGGDFLDFGSFGAVTNSPIGGFNDLAVFSSLIVVLGLITLLQLPLRSWMQWLVSALILLSTVFLAIVNFFFLWIIVGFFSLLFLIYLLSKDTLFRKENTANVTESSTSVLLIFVTLAVCLVSGLFVVAGDVVGGKISEATDINYVEVRPSMGATLDMMKTVYSEDMLLGSGPNRFSDIWRLHKDKSINETAFWNVDFVTGFGFVPTLFVTLGILGGLLVIAFHGSYLYMGYRMLLRTDTEDSFWYYVATASFTASLLLWLVTYIYAPGAAILLLAALFTGLSFVGYQALVPSSTITVPLATTQRRGFFLMAVSVVLVVSAVTVLFSVGKQYIAEAGFREAQATATTVEEFEIAVQSAYELYPDDTFVLSLAQAKLITLRQLLTLTEPSESDQQKFADTAQQVILLAQEAAQLDQTNPDAHEILANAYYALAQAGLTGAQEQAWASLEDAKWRDPLNPTYALLSAYMSAQSGELETARTSVGEALELKRNFGEALFLLAQIDIQEGDVESAIATTHQLVTFEPNNPTRYYQLGILLAAGKKPAEAITAYQTALARDPNFANARYMLALTLVEQGKTAEAIEELKIVQQNNQENTELSDLIKKLESGDFTPSELGLEAPVSEANPNETTEDGVVTTAKTDTDLVSPVNTPAETTNTQNQNNTVSAEAPADTSAEEATQ